jgi:hypothetical protein
LRACGGDLESFGTKSETTRCRLVFIDSNLSVAVHKQEPLLVVLELIRNSSRLKLLLMKVLSEVVQG